MTPFNVHVCAKAVSASAALIKMEGEPFLMERKVDGERYVLHKKGGQLRFVSRTLKVRFVILLPLLSGFLHPFLLCCFPFQRSLTGWKS